MMSMVIEQALLEKALDWVTKHYQEVVPPEYVYHNLHHSLDVVHATEAISAYHDLTDREKTLLSISAYFHDTGYDQGPEGHEDRGKIYARTFLETNQIPEVDIQLVEELIDATKRKVQPISLLQKILRDADVSHIGSDHYWDRCSRVRQELLLTRKKFVPEAEWSELELAFIQNHQFHTDSAFTLYGKKKQKNIRRLKSYSKRVLLATTEEEVEEEQLETTKKKKKKKKGNKDLELKQINLGRGVETMYRTTYRTHLSLSSIADNKANIMLSINAIIISIVVSNLVPQFGDNPKLIIPTMILLAVCLTALVFAILSTRPKVTEGTFSREDIRQKRSNLLFFGNFYRMDLDDFHWGMMEMIKDSDFLYSSMTRDLYFLGVVLAKKYQFLRMCYGVFMYGLIAAVSAFAVAYLT